MTAILRPQDVAARWQCSEGHVYGLVSKGKLTGFRAGRLLRFRLDEIEAFEKAGSAPEPVNAYDKWKAARGQDQTQRRA